MNTVQLISFFQEAKQVETQNELPVVKPPLRRLYGNKNKSVVDSPNSAGSIQDLMNITYGLFVCLLHFKI